MYVPLVYLRQIYNVFVVRLYFLNKHLSQCYRRFFNVYYFDNIKDEYQDLVSCDKEIKSLLNDSDIKNGMKILINIGDMSAHLYWMLNLFIANKDII